MPHHIRSSLLAAANRPADRSRQAPTGIKCLPWFSFLPLDLRNRGVPSAGVSGALGKSFHMMIRRRLIFILLLSSAVPQVALAQADPDTIAQTERIKAETDLEKAKTDKMKAETDRIKALGLPSFEGKTELGTNAGAMEATLLSAKALAKAASYIATKSKIKDLKKIIILTKDEALDFSQASAIELEMEAIDEQYDLLGVDSPPKTETMKMSGFPAVIGALNAVAGLFRSDASLSYMDASGMDDRMLVWAVSSEFKGEAILPGAIIADSPGTTPKKLIGKYNWMAQRRALAGMRRDELAKDKDKKEDLAALKALIARHDGFSLRVTTPNDQGVVPLLSAARLADLREGNYPILRVHVDKAGGSLVNTKNIATTFGVDPLKVSGAVVASYIMTDPKTGFVTTAGILSCSTTLTSIRKVQDEPEPIKSRCSNLLSNQE